ncbi:MAG: response regulator [Proteobacteria bacterium]|nr:response regulator [Pseudomonadota bacterium]
MSEQSVLIVEDDVLVAMDIEAVLTRAGYQVCGVAVSQAEALAMADRAPPDFAVVDISLSPGDGRVVARELWRRHRTSVLFASGQCEEVRGLEHSGAMACLPKPYQAESVPAALRAVADIRAGHPPPRLPDNMFPLRAA